MKGRSTGGRSLQGRGVGRTTVGPGPKDVEPPIALVFARILCRHWPPLGARL